MENEMLAEKKLTQSVISIKPLLLKKVLYAGSYFLAAALIEIITFATLGSGLCQY